MVRLEFGYVISLLLLFKNIELFNGMNRKTSDT